MIVHVFRTPVYFIVLLLLFINCVSTANGSVFRLFRPRVVDDASTSGIRRILNKAGSWRNDSIGLHSIHPNREKISSSLPFDTVIPVSRSNFQENVKRDESILVGNGFWPPWPFSLLQQIDRNRDGSSEPRHRSKSLLLVVWGYTKSTTKAGLRNFQEFGSQLWFHSPPAIPPIVLYALYPYRQRFMAPPGMAATAENLEYTRIIPLWSNGWVRNGILFATVVAISSWAHSEIHRQRNLTPLPLIYRDLNRAELPPFLPEQVSTTVLLAPIDNTGASQPIASIDQEDGETGASAEIQPTVPISSTLNVDKDAAVFEGLVTNLSPRLRRHWMQLRDITPKPKSLKNTIVEWKRTWQVGNAEKHNAHRIAIYEELATWQQVLQNAKGVDPSTRRGWNPFNIPNNNTASTSRIVKENHPAVESDELGYALVTGASKGIGRAIAVELARWHIPLILVARDVSRLTDLAYDLQTCYGVDCAVLPADLSRPRAAEQIYKSVKEAGLNVDILVNNAGISSHGETLNMSLEEVQKMLQVNTMAVTSLTHLFGQDMKERRRGRILLVSSICGAVNGIATVAVYAATKAYENSFGTAVGKELERYGVGVTCLMPGAVRGTEFRSQSNSYEALCWKVPFYTKSPPAVAECGVRAMLRGDTEVMPGVLNRLFVKVFKPILPQRMHNLVAEIMWNPLQLPFRRRSIELLPALDETTVNTNSSTTLSPISHTTTVLRPQMSQNSPLPPPRLLNLDTLLDEQKESDTKLEVGNSTTDLSTNSEIEPNDLAAPRTIDDSLSQAERNAIEPQNFQNEQNGTNSNLNPTTSNVKDGKQSQNPSFKTVPSSELDLLLDQYKRHRAISIDDPWSTGFNDNHIGDPMIPNLKETDNVLENDEM